MRRDPRAACIVGTAKRTWHDGSEAPEPLAMWEEVVRDAVDDVGTSYDVTRALGSLGVVHCMSWSYDDPAGRLADRLGRSDVATSNSILAGTSPQRLLAQAAASMATGDLDVAIVVGAEAQATRRRYDLAGEPAPWSFPAESDASVLSQVAQWYLPTELRHGVVAAWLTFALLDQARWAHRGGRPEDRARTAARLAALSEVAAANPFAWHRRRWTGDELMTATPQNRQIVTPYTKCSTAFPAVDMAAANILVTTETADRWGVPEDRRVYLRSSAFARDASHIAGRSDLASSPAMRRTTSEALLAAGMVLDEIDAFDLYSCFGSAVSFAADALGLAADDPRPRTLTGGLPFHGGPGSNYMSHSICHAVDAIRRGDHRSVLVTGIGMHMAKHVAAVWSAEPGPTVLSGTVAQEGALADNAMPVVDSADCAVACEAAAVVHDRDGSAQRAVAIGRLLDGARCYAVSTDASVMEGVTAGAWVGAEMKVWPSGGGTNEFTL